MAHEEVSDLGKQLPFNTVAFQITKEPIVQKIVENLAKVEVDTVNRTSHLNALAPVCPSFKVLGVTKHTRAKTVLSWLEKVIEYPMLHDMVIDKDFKSSA